MSQADLKASIFFIGVLLPNPYLKKASSLFLAFWIWNLDFLGHVKTINFKELNYHYNLCTYIVEIPLLCENMNREPKMHFFFFFSTKELYER